MEFREMNVQLRQIGGESADLAQLEEINAEAIPEEERVSLEDMGATGAEIIGIYAGGEPAGFLTVRHYRQIHYLAFLAVRKDLRSLGIGSMAVKALIRMHPDQQNVVEYEAPEREASADDIKARRKNFYLRNGFYETGWNTHYDGTEFEIGCSDPDFDADAFKEFSKYLETIVSDHIPRPYRKN